MLNLRPSLPKSNKNLPENYSYFKADKQISAFRNLPIFEVSIITVHVHEMTYDYEELFAEYDLQMFLL